MSRYDPAGQLFAERIDQPVEDEVPSPWDAFKGLVNGLVVDPIQSCSTDFDLSTCAIEAGTTVIPFGKLTKVSKLRDALRAAEAAEDLPAKDSWANPATLGDHFKRHGNDFGAASPDDYARKASEFFRDGLGNRLPTRVDADGTIRIYDPKTNTFGSFEPDGRTKTFFKPTSPTYWDRQPGVSR